MTDLRPRCRFRTLALPLLATISVEAVADDAPSGPPKSAWAPEIRVSGRIVAMPIVMVREYPFISGSVAGVGGKLMLDTGMESALTVNDHLVPFTGGPTIGKGFFGSGQTYVVRLAAEISDIRIGGLSYPRASHVVTQDARQLEGITPDFIGWVGFRAFADHALKLDYRKLRVTFYRDGPADYLKGERIVAELPFETRKLPNHPVIPARIGDLAIVTAWDTGQFGMMNISKETKSRLIAAGHLTTSRRKPNTFDLQGLKVNGHLMPLIRGIRVRTEPSPSAAALGIGEPDELSIGYGLLHQFKTVWDYRRRRIYLLAR